MARISKKRKAINELITYGKVYKFDEALELINKLPKANFKKNPESVDVSIQLGVDPRKSDQMVRGATVMPHGNGKQVRVAVFTQGPNVEIAKEAGADIVGMDDLAEEIKQGNFDFNVLIASPDAMGLVGRLGQILGPRGLMPNPKVGTVTPDVGKAVRNAKAGQVRYRTDKNGIIHASIGNISFSLDALVGNVQALLYDLVKAKPSTAKGVYLQKLSVSTTMGPGLAVDLNSLKF